MFELPDDDDNFWEDLPLDDITNSKSPKLKTSTQNVPPQCDPQNKGTCRVKGQSLSKGDQNRQEKDEEDRLAGSRCYQGQGYLPSTTNLLKLSDINFTMTNTSSSSVEDIPKNCCGLPTLDTSNCGVMSRDKIPQIDEPDKGEVKTGKRLSSESASDSSKKIRLIEDIHQSLERPENERGVVQTAHERVTKPQTPVQTQTAHERVTKLQTPVTHTWNQTAGGESGSVKQPLSTGHPAYQVVASARRQTPDVTRDGNSTPVIKKTKRKFPGPAGLLPKLSGNPEGIREAVSHSLKTSPQQTPLQKEDMILSSQSADDVFSDDPWRTLMEELGGDGQRLLSNFSIANNLLKARKKQLHRGKVPLLMCVIDNIEWHGSDLSVSLKDRSGDVQGTVHRDIVKEYESEFQVGSALVLRQVSVISPNPRSHYLNITPANIVFIYSKNGDSCKQINTRDTRLSAVVEEVQREESRERHRIDQSGTLNTPNRNQSVSLNTPNRNQSVSLNTSNRNFTQAQQHQINQSVSLNTPNRNQLVALNTPNTNFTQAQRHQINQSVSLNTPNRNFTQAQRFQNRTPQFRGNSSTPSNPNMYRTPQFGMSSTPGNSQVTRSSQLGRPSNGGPPQMQSRTPHCSEGPLMSGVRTPLNEYSSGNRAIEVPHQTHSVRTPGAPAVHQTADRMSFCQTPNRNVHNLPTTPASVSACTSVFPKTLHSQPQVMHTKNQSSVFVCHSQTNHNQPSSSGAFHSVPVLNQTSDLNKSSPCDPKESLMNDEQISNQQSTPGRRSFKFKSSKTQVQTSSSSDVALNSTSSSSAPSHSRPTSTTLTSTNKNSNHITSISNAGDKPKFEVDSLWGEDLSDDMLSQLSEEF